MLSLISKTCKMKKKNSVLMEMLVGLNTEIHDFFQQSTFKYCKVTYVSVISRTSRLNDLTNVLKCMK